MTKISTRRLGRTDLALTELGMGCAPLGELFECISEEQAQATLRAAWDAGVRYFDTSPFYGHGKSEHRLGQFLRQRDRDEFVVSTKIGRVFTAAVDPRRFDPAPWRGALPFEFRFDYSYDGVMRSWEDSLHRLGLAAVDLLLVHDLDPGYHSPEVFDSHLRELADSGCRALGELRDAGRIGGIGVGINCLGMIPRFLDAFDPDFFLVAMPFTLLDQGVLENEFPRCAERGVGIIIGAVYASGILVTGPVDGARYAYAPAAPEILEKARRIESVCRRFDVPLAAAALQFPLRHPLVSAIIPGALAPEHVRQTTRHLERDIPDALWTELEAEGLVRR